MKRPLNEEQPPNEEQPSHQLNKKVCHSGGLMYTPAEIIIYITDFTEYFDGANVLKQVNKHLHKIIESGWPPIHQDLFEFWLNTNWHPTLQDLFKFRSNTKTKCTLKRDFYQFCMRLNKEKAIHNYGSNNPSMDLLVRYYLAAIMNGDSLSHYQTKPSQWNVIMLKDEKCDIALNQVWTDYLTSCHNLVYLILDNVSHIYLDLTLLTNLEGLFLGYTAAVKIPSSMKMFVSYTSKEKYREHETQLSSYTRFVRLDALERSIELELW
jgi:hypothetical protein